MNHEQEKQAVVNICVWRGTARCSHLRNHVYAIALPASSAIISEIS
jgi:hypothetical protein